MRSSIELESRTILEIYNQTTDRACLLQSTFGLFVSIRVCMEKLHMDLKICRMRRLSHHLNFYAVQVSQFTPSVFSKEKQNVDSIKYVKFFGSFYAAVAVIFIEVFG